jgi:hypothetical protein
MNHLNFIIGAAYWVWPAAGIAAVAAAIATLGFLWLLRQRGMDRWLATYIAQAGKRGAPPAGKPVHVLLCIADHYEPMVGRPSTEQAAQRVENWVSQYPRLFAGVRDSDGKPPQHTFFFPIDEYDAKHVDAIAGLCRAGYGEVEIHHHHDHDTAEALGKRLTSFVELFRDRHGVLPRDRRTGKAMYGFVHGNWALDNSRPDGRWCGVNNELDVLRETGCYADFTLPSAPSPTQTRKINSIYYAKDDPARPKSHDWGVDAGAGPRPADSLMLIQGPLLLNWRSRRFGIVPRIENACLQSSQPPTMARLNLWLRARVQVPQRPDWYFVKLHTHGALERNQAVLLGAPMVQFHADLAARASRDKNFHYHYVTAREMYNLAAAAEAGWQGSVEAARDFALIWEKSSLGKEKSPATGKAQMGSVGNYRPSADLMKNA